MKKGRNKIVNKICKLYTKRGKLTKILRIKPLSNSLFNFEVTLLISAKAWKVKDILGDEKKI